MEQSWIEVPPPWGAGQDEGMTRALPLSPRRGNPELRTAAATIFIHTPNILILQYVINMFNATLLTHYPILYTYMPEGTAIPWSLVPSSFTTPEAQDLA